MTSDTWLYLNRPEFNHNQIRQYKDLEQMYYGYELQVDAGNADVDRCRMQAAEGVNVR